MIKDILNLKIWQSVILGNMVKNYLIALAAFFVLLVVFKIFQKIIMGRLKKVAQKTRTDADNALIKIVQSIKPPFYFFLAFWLALKFLYLTEVVDKIIDALLMIWLILLVIKTIQILITYVARRKIREEDSERTVTLVSQISKGIIWILGVLLILQNLGVNITSLIAALGIGGVAIALAAQNILGDLFSSFAIHFDKPFVIGDFIVVGDEMGTVEKIGIKTTRIRSPQGEEIIISNRELTSARVHNFKRLERRRAVLSIALAYDTPQEKLKKIPEMFKEIIEPIELTTFDRTHLKQFGDSALIFEVVYYAETQDYVKYLDINHQVHLKIKEALKKEKISIAFPTQTIHLKK